MDQSIEQQIILIGNTLVAHHAKLVTAESCTGGGLAYMLTMVPGSSMWFDRGWVTYSNMSKIELLHVNPETLERYGAVSEETASEMAEGALHHTTANVSIAITGIAGPNGGSADKPVGTVWIALAMRHANTKTYLHHFSGTRHFVREETIKAALRYLESIVVD